MEALIRELLVKLGEDPGREGLRKTPERVAAALSEMMSGYAADPDEILRCAVFEEGAGGVVACRDIHFVSMCEHHLLPFVGDVTIAYLPDRKLVGISKLVRLTEAFARRLQVQERMGQQIADTVARVLEPRAVLVRISALHLCMVARGVQQEKATMVTQHTSGLFEKDPSLILAMGLGGR
jgi:GTP cyclohydrolase I